MKGLIHSIKEKFQVVFSKLRGPSRRLKNNSSETSDNKNKAKRLSKEQLLSYLEASGQKFKEILGRGIQKLKKSNANGKKNNSIEFESKRANLTFDEMIMEFFHPSNRKLIHSLFIYSLLVSGAFTVGKMIGLLLTPNQVAQTKKSSMGVASSKHNDIKSEMDIVKTANIFNSKMENSDSKKPKNENIICLQSETLSSLPVKLLSTVVLQDSVKSVASIQVRGDELINLREGERIQTMAEIGKINRLKIVIKNLENGDCEFIGNDKEIDTPLNVVSPSKGRQLLQKVKNSKIQTDGKKFVIKKSLRDDMLKDISKIVTQARAIQMRNDDGSLCFKMTEIEPGSVYSMLDIQDGDTICEINGSKITDLNVLMNMFGRIQEIENFSLGLKREGEPLAKTYQFVD